jgi:hypothetical protein
MQVNIAACIAIHGTRLRCLGTFSPLIHTTLAGHVARMGELRNAYEILVGKLEGKRPPRSPRRTW